MANQLLSYLRTSLFDLEGGQYMAKAEQKETSLSLALSSNMGHPGSQYILQLEHDLLANGPECADEHALSSVTTMMSTSSPDGDRG